MKKSIKKKVLIPVLISSMAWLTTVSQAETLPVVGKVAELIMAHGNILGTECGEKYKRRWKFCTSTVELSKPVDGLRGYVGDWECSRYLNDNGDHLNIVCRRRAREY